MVSRAFAQAVTASMSAYRVLSRVKSEVEETIVLVSSAKQQSLRHTG